MSEFETEKKLSDQYQLIFYLETKLKMLSNLHRLKIYH